MDLNMAEAAVCIVGAICGTIIALVWITNPRNKNQ